MAVAPARAEDSIGTRILITGASRGIGAAVARRLAAPGRRMLLLARSEESLRRLARELGEGGTQAEWKALDLEGVDQAHRALEAAAKMLGEVDTAVLAAGYSARGNFAETDLEALEREARVNYLAPLGLIHGLVQSMKVRGRGHVVVVGSLAGGPVPFPTNAGYSASKAALLALVRSVRPELAGSGVHLGIVLPGPTRSAMNPEGHGWLPVASPEEVAASVVECLQERAGVKTPGWSNQMLEALARVLPGPFEQALSLTGEWLLPRR